MDRFQRQYRFVMIDPSNYSRVVTACLLAGVLAVSGCSWFSSDSTKKPASTAAAKPPEKKPTKVEGKASYPNLASVPNKAPGTASVRQRMQIEEGLQRDRKNARHVAGPVAGQHRSTSGTTKGGKVKTQIFTPKTKGQIVMDARRRALCRRWQATRPIKRNIRPNGFVARINFPAGSTSLSGGAGRAIVEVAQLHRWAGGSVRVVAYGDRGAANAAAVAAGRARTVRNGLLSMGVSKGRVAARSSARAPNARTGRSALIFLVGHRRC